MAVQKKVDVVTIGAGWTSGILGWKLGFAGHKVVALEAGPVRYADPDFEHNHDALKHEVHKAMMYDISRETWTWRPNPKAPSLPIRQFGSFHPGRGIGCASVHWTARLWRFMPEDFQHLSHNIERYGKDKIPEGMTIQDWPITYDELEPYYDAFEYDIGAAGATGNLNGQILEGGNPFEAPRSLPYPLPAHPLTIGGQMFHDTTAEMGLNPFPNPAGILSRAYESPLGDTRAACIYCGFCTRYGCEVDAKSQAPTHISRPHCGPGLRDSDQQPGDRHQRQCRWAGDRCQLHRSADRRGARAAGGGGVASGYTLTNVRMLLMSRSSAHPNGIGNDREQVGKNYTYQIYGATATGIFEGRRLNRSWRTGSPRT